MCKATIVVHVQMGENYFSHVARSNSDCAQLRADFFFTLNSKNDFPPQKWMIGPRRFEQMNSLSGIDDDDALWMLDCPDVGWQPLSPIRVGENGQLSSKSVPAPRNLRSFYFNGASLDCMNTHGTI